MPTYLRCTYILTIDMFAVQRFAFNIESTFV